MTDAGVLRCPSCGAPTDPKAPACAHCAAPLHALRCPWCFGWTYKESAGCARCGSAPVPTPAPPRGCPTCSRALTSRARDGAVLAGCDACGGVWADPVSFRSICEDRDAKSAHLGAGTLVAPPKPSDPTSSPVVYRPCAVCGQLMNRFNFANKSGVVLDACRPHGVWFDADELRRIVAFIRAGGLEAARADEIERLERERKKFEEAAREARSARESGELIVPPIASASFMVNVVFHTK